jgi:hypothetical protein
MIKPLLTALLSIGFLFAIREWKQSRMLCTAIMLLTVAGMYLVWEQQASTTIAHFLGVGRGADLVLYIYTAISFVLIISLLLRIKNLQEQITELIRVFALAHPFKEHAFKEHEVAESTDEKMN